jgi:hypothetical protein
VCLPRHMTDLECSLNDSLPETASLRAGEVTPTPSAHPPTKNS